MLDTVAGVRGEIETYIQGLNSTDVAYMWMHLQYHYPIDGSPLQPVLDMIEKLVEAELVRRGIRGERDVEEQFDG